MKQILYIVFLFLFLNVKGQNNVKDDIAGSWKVENVILNHNKDLNNKDLKEVARTFKNSIFSFKVNHDFILILKEQTKVSAMLNEMLNKQKWIFDKQRKMIKIGTEKDRYTIMGIYIKIENSKTYFILDESGLKLELVKI